MTPPMPLDSVYFIRAADAERRLAEILAGLHARESAAPRPTRQATTGRADLTAVDREAMGRMRMAEPEYRRLLELHLKAEAQAARESTTSDRR